MPEPILTKAIDALASGHDLAREQAEEVLRTIMAGETSEIEISAFLIALRTKGETEDELAGLAAAMRALAVHVGTQRHDLLDTAGTGGGRSTFNVSTTAALIAAGAGCAVAKHGNRSATSRSGSADVLEALGARIDLPSDLVGRCIDDAGFGFMFAPLHHQATRFVIPVRRELAVRTVFNLLGPLTNPAGARRQLIGVADASYLDRIAGALHRLGVDRALVVSGADGLDEMSTFAPTHVVEVDEAGVRRYTVNASDFGLQNRSGPDGVAGGSPHDNAEVSRAILVGQDGPARDLALLNAGAAIYVGGGADSIAAGVEAAAAAIDDGRAAAALARYVERSNELAPAQAAT